MPRQISQPSKREAMRRHGRAEIERAIADAKYRIAADVAALLQHNDPGIRSHMQDWEKWLRAMEAQLAELDHG